MGKRYIKIPVFIAVLCVLIVGYGSQAAIAEPLAEDDPIEEIQMHIEGGFKGVSKLGAWAPFHITILSKKENIIGELQVEAHLDQARKIILAKPVSLTAGIKQEVYFEIPVVTAKKGLDIRIVENKKTMAEQTYQFTRLLPPEIMTIGVLSEEPDAFGWLGGNTIPVATNNMMDEEMKMRIASGQMQSTIAVPTAPSSDGKEITYKNREAVVIPLDRRSFPENSEVMDGFDFLIISKFDTGLLKVQQVETLEKWVDTGGVFMMGTGLNWQKVYHGLPDSLKPFSIKGTRDFDSTEIMAHFTQRETPEMNLKLAEGEIGFEYVPAPGDGLSTVNAGIPTRFLDQDIIVGNSQNPLLIRYRKGVGSILVFTFEPTAEPFASYKAKGIFIDYVLRHLNVGMQRFADYGNGFFQKQNTGRNHYLQNLSGEIPGDKKPPFQWMFIGLGIYVVLVGPVLYLILKKLDRRDWAWAFIPVLSIVFLTGMYLMGFQSRYNTAITNTVSVIEPHPESNEAVISSVISVFNNKRGTMKLEYDNGNGMQMPLVQNTGNYRYYGNNTEGSVVGKSIIADQMVFEQYDVMLWTPTMLFAEKTIPFDTNLFENIYLEDGSLKGTVQNTTPYDLLDTVVLIGTNIIPIGDILSGDTKPLDVPLQGENVYKRPDEYLDGEFGRSHYISPKDYPPDYQEQMRKRRMFENNIHEWSNMAQGKTGFILLAQNEQIIDYGLVVNAKQPQKYNRNLIHMESSLEFQPGQEVEIPGGIICPNYYQNKEVGWQEGRNGIRIHDTGEMEFVFQIPETMDVSEMQLFVESYIPLYVQYNILDQPNLNYETRILTNEYAYSLYNVKTQDWDTIEAETTISNEPGRYIGAGNEVRMKITVIELGRPEEETERAGAYREYQQELLSMPELRLKGVARE